MDGLILLGVLVLVALPVAVVYLLVSHTRLRQRVDALQFQLATLRSGAVPDAVAEPTGLPDPAQPGPWDKGGAATLPAEPVRPAEHQTPPRAIVLRRDRLTALAKWLRENWFYAISAVSLALAGIFLVQYGMEQGLLPPVARVGFALLFGAVLVASGEVIRRRFGDTEDSSAAYLPSTFSGAGIVVLFAAIISARQLYGLIGPELALAGLVLTAASGIVLGWFYGPLLAAIGIAGAMGAPFVVGGDSTTPYWLYGYFALIAGTGLAVDAVRRWAWVSVLSLVLAFGAAWLLYAGSGGAEYYMAFAVSLTLASIAIPPLSLAPAQSGTALSSLITRRKAVFPEFPTRLVAGTLMSACAILFGAAQAGQAEVWLALMLFTVLIAALALWCRNAPALGDLAVLPAAGFLAVVAFEAMDYGAVYRAFSTLPEPNTNAPFAIAASVIAGLGLLGSLMAGWRSLVETHWPRQWAAGAAIFAPLTAILLEALWHPARVIGAYPWALHAVVIAAVMTVLAERFSRRDGADRMRTSFAVLGALVMIALAFVLVLSSAALTVALAITVLAAAALDRRFDLPPLSAFIQLGAVVLGYRLVADPGIDFGFYGPLGAVLLSFLGAIGAVAGASYALGSRHRPATKVVLESAMFGYIGVFASVMLFRAIKASTGSESGFFSHWGMGIAAVIWLAAGFAQIDRIRAGGPLAGVRKVLGGVFWAIALVAVVFAAVLLNPLSGGNFLFGRDAVLGPVFANTLAVAYLFPAVALGLIVQRLTHLNRRVRQGLGGLGVALAVLYSGLAIRHFWRGADIAASGVTSPELYSYTVALLIAGAGLLYQAIARRAPLLRKAGMGVIGLTVAKVFLIDIAGLSGLTRVFSLLALGLSLAGLAWLNRWAAGRAGGHGAEPPAPT